MQRLFADLASLHAADAFPAGMIRYPAKSQRNQHFAPPHRHLFGLFPVRQGNQRIVRLLRGRTLSYGACRSTRRCRSERPAISRPLARTGSEVRRHDLAQQSRTRRTAHRRTPSRNAPAPATSIRAPPRVWPARHRSSAARGGGDRSRDATISISPSRCNGSMLRPSVVRSMTSRPASVLIVIGPWRRSRLNIANCVARSPAGAKI